MPADVLGWLTALTGALHGMATMVKDATRPNRRKLAQRLIGVCRDIQDITTRGENIVAALSAFPLGAEDELESCLYIYSDPPFTDLDLAVARPNEAQLGEFVELLKEQEKALLRLDRVFRQRPFRNLDVVFPGKPEIEAAVILKFGTISILLSQASRTPLPTDLKNTSIAEASRFLNNPMASYGSFKEPFYNLRVPEKGSRAISRLIYSRAELREAADRVRQLDASGRKLLELIRDEFSIEEIL